MSDNTFGLLICAAVFLFIFVLFIISRFDFGYWMIIDNGIEHYYKDQTIELSNTPHKKHIILKIDYTNNKIKIKEIK